MQSTTAIETSTHFYLARRLFWLVFGLHAAMIGGRAWDGYWHTTHRFESFFSPPHVFIFVTAGLASLVTAIILLNRDLRRWFGPGFRVPGSHFEIPGALALVAGGYGLTIFAGAGLDNLWHSRLGLDETMWSFPHAVAGWSQLISLLGLVACCIALHRQQPFSQYVTLLLGFIILGFSAAAVLGPFYELVTPRVTQALARLPVFAPDLRAQHTFQIFLYARLDRTNPLLAALGAAWAGVALAFLRGLDRRARVLLATAVLWTLVTMLGDYGTALRLDQISLVSSDPASWLPLPVIPAALIFLALAKTRLGERWAWCIAGWAFGLCVFLFWGMEPLTALLAVLAGPAMVIGANVGQRVYRICENPTLAGTSRLLLVGVVVPLCLGLIDLRLRAVTP